MKKHYYLIVLLLLAFGVQAWNLPSESDGAYVILDFENNFLDTSTLNGSTNFVNNTGGTTLSNGGFITGRNGLGLQTLASGDAHFIHNHSDPFAWTNDTGAFCISWQNNGSYAENDYILSAGRSGVGSCQYQLLWNSAYAGGSGGLRLERAECESGTHFQIDLHGFSNGSEWNSMCSGWVRDSVWWAWNNNGSDANALITYGTQFIDPNGKGYGYFGSIRNVYASTGGDTTRIGGGLGNTSVSVSRVYDGFVAFDHNLTIAEVRNYITGTWSTPNFTINSPNYLVHNNSDLYINFTVIGQLQQQLNVTLFINGTINATLNNLFNGSNRMINTSILQDGTYNWTLMACDNSIGKRCGNVSYLFVVDKTYPNITSFIHANNDVRVNTSSLNLTYNFTIRDNWLLWGNITAFFMGDASTYFSHNFTNDTTFWHNISFNINFTKANEGNYTIQTLACDNNGTGGCLNTTNYTFWFYADRSAPAINLTSIAEGQLFTGVTTVNLTFNITDKIATYCFYHINRSNSSIVEQSSVQFPCNATTLHFATLGVLTTDTTYIIGFNASDGTNYNFSSRTFRIESGGGGGGGSSSSGGGGGGGGGVAEKKNCLITISPLSVSITNSEPLQEVIITNNDTISYNPTYVFKEIGENDTGITTNLKITNEVNTILQGQTESFGVQYTGTSTQANQANLVLTTTDCKDITIPIVVNQKPPIVLASFFDPAKDYYTNIIEFLDTPLHKDFPDLKVWMGYAFIFVIGLYLSLDTLRNTQRTKGLFVAGFQVILLIVTTVIVTIVSKLALSVVGGG